VEKIQVRFPFVARRIAHHLQSSLHLVRLAAAPPNVEWMPNADIYENEDAFVVRVELAGVSRDHLQTSVVDQTLIVRGHRPDPCRTGRCRFRQMEIDHGVFERRFIIPPAVDARQIKATFADGILTLELPKRAPAVVSSLKVVIRSA